MPKSSDLHGADAQQQPQRIGAVAKPLSLKERVTASLTPIATPRVRSHDTFVSASEHKLRTAQCRRTVTIGETVYRCDQRHKEDLTTHSETGIVKRKGKLDVRYSVNWTETPPVTIRHA